MVANTRPQQWKKEASERLTGTGERDKSRLIDLRFERGQVLGFGKGRRQNSP